MTQPSKVIDEIVTSLSAGLPDLVEVKSIEGDFGPDGAKYTTSQSTAVLVTCLGFRSVQAEQSPPLATAHFAAFCMVKNDAADTTKMVSAASVAADLAATVTCQVATSRWQTVARAPTNLRSINLRRIGERTAANVWGVEWLQDLELTPVLDPAPLRRLKTIATTYAMGDEHTPDVSSEQTFPGPPEPPAPEPPEEP